MGFMPINPDTMLMWMQEAAIIHPAKSYKEKPSVEYIITLLSSVNPVRGTDMQPSVLYVPGKVSNAKNIGFGGESDWITPATNEAYEREIKLEDGRLVVNNFDTWRPAPRNLWGRIRYPIQADITNTLLEEVSYDDDNGFSKIRLQFDSKKGYRVGRIGFFSQHGLMRGGTSGDEEVFTFNGPYRSIAEFLKIAKERVITPAQPLYDLVITGDSQRHTFDVVHQHNVAKQHLFTPQNQKDLYWVFYFLATGLDCDVQIRARKVRE